MRRRRHLAPVPRTATVAPCVIMMTATRGTSYASVAAVGDQGAMLTTLTGSPARTDRRTGNVTTSTWMFTSRIKSVYKVFRYVVKYLLKTLYGIIHVYILRTKCFLCKMTQWRKFSQLNLQFLGRMRIYCESDFGLYICIYWNWGIV